MDVIKTVLLKKDMNVLMSQVNVHYSVEMEMLCFLSNVMIRIMHLMMVVHLIVK